MMIYCTTIGEIYTHIHEVIAGQICRKMIQQLGLTNYFGNRIYFISEMSGPSKSSNTDKLPLLNENEFKCTIKYNTNPFGIKWDSTTPGQHLDPGLYRRDNLRTPPVFWDPLHKITLNERYLPCNVSMECEMHFVDRVVAFDVMNRICSTYVRGELLMVNDLSYDYRMPPEILRRLSVMSDMIGLQHGNFMDWLNQCSRGQITQIVSQRQTNQDSEIVIKKHQFGTLAAIDYNPDSPEFSSIGTSMDQVTIRYNVAAQFGRVNMLYLEYPIVVGNKFIPESLVTADPQDAYGKLYKQLRHTYTALDAGYQIQKMLLEHPARNPWYDDWFPPKESSLSADCCKAFFIGVFTLDNDLCQCKHPCKCDCGHKYTEINIRTDLDQYHLAPQVLDWYKKHPTEALNTESKYSIVVFKDNIQIGPSVLLFDGEVLKFPNCKGPGHVYRLVLCATMRTLADGCPWNMLLLNFDIESEKEK